jgi:hypothetical protein
MDLEIAKPKGIASTHYMLANPRCSTSYSPHRVAALQSMSQGRRSNLQRQWLNVRNNSVVSGDNVSGASSEQIFTFDGLADRSLNRI